MSRPDPGCDAARRNASAHSSQVPATSPLTRAPYRPVAGPLAKGRLASWWSCDIGLGIARTAAERTHLVVPGATSAMSRESAFGMRGSTGG
jgi:hypothetical protein